MEPLDDLQARRILEVAPDATLDEISRAYHLLKRAHGRESALTVAPGMDEFGPDARQVVLAEIEAAHARLRRLGGVPPAAVPPACGETAAAPAGHPVRAEADQVPAGPSGLRQAREAAGISLDHVAAETHVRREYLSALEDLRFEKLPLAAVNVRGYLTAYANAIGLAPDKVVPPYMERFAEWQGRRSSQATRPPGSAGGSPR